MLLASGSSVLLEHVGCWGHGSALVVRLIARLPCGMGFKSLAFKRCCSGDDVLGMMSMGHPGRTMFCKWLLLLTVRLMVLP